MVLQGNPPTQRLLPISATGLLLNCGNSKWVSRGSRQLSGPLPIEESDVHGIMSSASLLLLVMAYYQIGTYSYGLVMAYAFMA